MLSLYFSFRERQTRLGEKPLAGNAQEAKKMWEAAQKSKAKVMVCFLTIVLFLPFD